MVNKNTAKKQQRREYKERITNWYMLNLTYSVIGIIALLAANNGYNSGNMVIHMQTIMWVFTAVFAVGAVALFVTGKAKGCKRATNYGALSVVCGLVTLWLALYNAVRPVIESVARAVLNNPQLSVYSYWNIRIPIIAICVWLVISFVWYAVKLAKK